MNEVLKVQGILLLYDIEHATVVHCPQMNRKNAHILEEI